MYYFFFAIFSPPNLSFPNFRSQLKIFKHWTQIRIQNFIYDLENLISRWIGSEFDKIVRFLGKDDSLLFDTCSSVSHDSHDIFCPNRKRLFAHKSEISIWHDNPTNALSRICHTSMRNYSRCDSYPSNRYGCHWILQIYYTSTQNSVIELPKLPKLDESS